MGTLISTLSGRAGSESELNLIAAADQAAPTKRYIPSIWGFKPSEELVRHHSFGTNSDFHRVAEKFPPAKDKLTFLAALSKTSLEYTAWYPGYFLDYFVFPGVRSNMNIFRLVLDVEHNVAAIPGSGNVPVIFTHTLDIAKFVAASLSFPKWSNETYVVGDRLTFNEALAIAEEVKGTKFKVTYDSVELLRSGKVTELPSHAQMYPFFPEEQLQGFLAIVGLLFENGECDFPTDQTINHDVPEIKAGTFRELMVEAWKGK